MSDNQTGPAVPDAAAAAPLVIGADDSIGVVVPYRDMSTTCPTCWRSHGCDLPAGHPGDDTSHVCDPCPDGCSEPDLEDWPDGWSASVGRCSYHCGDHPISGDELFDVTPDGFTNERVLL